MNAVDRVMRAYAKTRNLTEDQANLVRCELSKFIDQLMRNVDSKRLAQMGDTPLVVSLPRMASILPE